MSQGWIWFCYNLNKRLGLIINSCLDQVKMQLKNLAEILVARRVAVGNSWGLPESELLNNRLDRSKSLYSRTVTGHFGCVNSIEFSLKDESLMASGTL